MHERVPLQLATRVNQVWSMDFVSDSLSNGRRLKYLTVADDFSHECVDITVDYGISGQYVTRLLDQAALFRGYPQVVRTDNVLNAIGVAQKEQAHSWLSKQPKKQRYLAALPNGHFHVLRRASIHHNEHKIQQ
ncbi:MAG: transposase [Betaproteobacteria bacterium]|nr:transposase [Betaproteobacteria bacterium]